MNFPINSYIALSGLIGAGKSRLAETLSHIMSAPLYKEPVEENPYLAMFYGDMAKYSFQMQIYLLKERFKQQQEIAWSERGAVQDRSIYEDLVFARVLTKQGKMSALDLETYTDLFWTLAKFMKHPQAIIFLDVSPEMAMFRIHTRGRQCERDIPLSYLQQLYDEYKTFLVELEATVQVIRIDYSEFMQFKTTHTASGMLLTIGPPSANQMPELINE